MMLADMETAISPELRKSIDEIKSELGKGEVVCRPRQTGKTAALLEFIHEHNPGNVNIIVINFHTQHWLKSRYKELYPQDQQPWIIPIDIVNDHNVRGTTREWVTDEIWPSAVIRKAGDYEYVNFLGGVSTPMCMDMHSK